MKKNFLSDREKLFKLEVEGREFVKNLRSLEQFIRTVKDHFLKQNALLTCSWRFLRSNILQQLEFRLEKNIGIYKSAGKVRKLAIYCDRGSLAIFGNNIVFHVPP